MAVLFRGYAGYLQLPPRLLGGLSTVVPIRQLAVYFAVSAAVVDALLAWFLYWASSGWIKSTWIRIALASLVVLMPALGNENTATITNTIWAFAAIAPWALISKSERPGAVVTRSAVAFLAATATPLVLIYAPLGLVNACVRRTRAAWIVTCAFGVGLALQIAVASHTEDTRTVIFASRQTSKLPPLISIRVFAQYLLSDKGINVVWGYRHVLVVVAPLVVSAIVVFLLLRVENERRLLAVTFVVLAVASFVIPVWERGTNRFVELTLADAFPFKNANTNYVPADRFVVVPVVLLACAIGVLVARSPLGGSTPFRRVAEFVVVGQIVLLAVIGFSVTNGRSVAPTWASSLARSYRARVRLLQAIDDGSGPHGGRVGSLSRRFVVPRPLAVTRSSKISYVGTCLTSAG